MAQLLTLLFGCIHRRTTWPRGSKPHTYVACLTCGQRLSYNFDEMRRVA